MKVLIFGSTGFFGSNIKKALMFEHQLYCADRRPNGTETGNFTVNALDKDKVIALLQRLRPEVIINCAGVVENSDKALINPFITTNILESVTASGIKIRSFVVSGSASEYGVVDEKSIPVREDAPLNANSGYGLSKRQETAAALEYGLNNGISVTIARIFNPIGTDMNPRMLVPNIIGQIRQIRDGLKDSIEVSRLDSRRDYIDIRDVALAVKSLVEHELKDSVYNVGSGKSVTNGELINMLVKQSRLSSQPKITETMIGKEPLVAYQADITKIKSELGWEPKIPMQQTIKDIIDAAG